MSRNSRKSVSKSRAIALILVALVITAALVSAVVAKYISNNKKAAEIHASGFHFSSNYLDPDGRLVPVLVSDWSSRGIVFQLYNYETENIAQISDSDIQYQIDVSTGWQVDTVMNSNGASVFANNGVYTMEKSDAQVAHTVTIKYVGTGEPSQAAEIAVIAVSQYEKTLKGRFELQTKADPTFNVTNVGGAVYLTIESNNYSGPIRVKWPGSEVSPDNANSNVDMSAWRNTNAGSGEVFQGEANHTYTLFFVKNSDADITNGFSVERGN